MAGLTTHVLDTAQGKPAEGVRVELYALDANSGRVRLAEVRTNANGRTDAPLIAAGAAHKGMFELVFHIGDYFAAQGLPQADPPFLDIVPIRFAIADPSAHYHVPLVASPWGYSTYRGS